MDEILNHFQEELLATFRQQQQSPSDRSRVRVRIPLLFSLQQFHYPDRKVDVDVNVDAGAGTSRYDETTQVLLSVLTHELKDKLETAELELQDRVRNEDIVQFFLLKQPVEVEILLLFDGYDKYRQEPDYIRQLLRGVLQPEGSTGSGLQYKVLLSSRGPQARTLLESTRDGIFKKAVLTNSLLYAQITPLEEEQIASFIGKEVQRQKPQLQEKVAIPMFAVMNTSALAFWERVYTD